MAIERPKYDENMKVCGEEFEYEDYRSAYDFADVLETFGAGENEELLESFALENLNVGQRLLMAHNQKLDSLGAMLVREEDDRLVRIIKKRIEEINKGSSHSSIILT